MYADPRVKSLSKTGWSPHNDSESDRPTMQTQTSFNLSMCLHTEKEETPLSLVGKSLDPSKTRYQGLALGDLVQLPDQSGSLRECRCVGAWGLSKGQLVNDLGLCPCTHAPALLSLILCHAVFTPSSV